jgi:hypothetical protein
MAKAPNKARQLEGEGSYSAARQYDSNVRSFVKKGNVRASADGARRAVEGEEGEALARAEKHGKAGPKPTSLKPLPKPARRAGRGL